METGRAPTATSRTRASFATSMTETVPSVSLVTKAKRLSSLKARSWPPLPVAISVTLRSARASRTVTPESVATQRYCPSGCRPTRRARGPVSSSVTTSHLVHPGRGVEAGDGIAGRLVADLEGHAGVRALHQRPADAADRLDRQLEG